MKLYEVMVIFSATLDETAYAAALKAAQELIVSKGGQITITDEWGKRKLAYPINKQDHGSYVVMQFTTDNNLAPREIQAQLAITDAVLRAMIVIAQKPLEPKVAEPTEAPAEAV